MRIPPIEVLNAWPTPNYVDPITRGNANIILNVVLYSFLMCFIVLRIYTRTRLAGQIGADDVFILLAMIPTSVFFIISILADTGFLWIRHQYDIPADHVVTGLKMVLSAEIMFAAGCTLTKLSMLMLVKRMLASTSAFWRSVTLLAILVVTIQGTIFCLTTIFQCRPPQNYWKITWDPQPECIDQGASLLVAGLVNTLTDFLVCLLPIRTVWTLQLPKRQVIVVVLLFAFGFCSCLAGVVRTYYTYRVTKEYDQTWYSYPVWITCAIELYVGICASIPATKPFFSTYLPQVFGTLSPTISKFTSSPRARSRNMAISLGSQWADDSELVSFENALKAGRGDFTNSSVASRVDKRGDDDKDDCIRVTQTVEMSSGKAVP